METSGDDRNSKATFIVHCGDCSHEWAAAYLPMDVRDFCKIAKSPWCPMCTSARVFVGPAKVADAST